MKPTRWNKAGLARDERLREKQERDNGFAARFCRVSRQIMDPPPFGDEMSLVPPPSLMIASPKGQAAARVRRERKNARLADQ